MPTCFVIQPFDSGKFDKRYKDTFDPAIRSAGLVPYRIDQDKGADVLINSIEEKIRTASVCLADITLDNPNVWYELGFAMAAGIPVVMICSKERQGKFPFDIQHRQITTYGTESSSDFIQLEADIKQRLLAAVERGQSLATIAATQRVASVDGLSPIEVDVLAMVAGSSEGPDGGAGLWSLQRDAEKALYSPLGFSLGIRRLRGKGFVEDRQLLDERGDAYPGYAVTSAGWDWIDGNESRFVIRKGETPIQDEDIPF